MRPEVIQPFWAALQVGEFISTAAEGVGTYRVKGRRWILAESGIRPRRGRDLKGRCLTFTEREEIALGRAGGESVRCLARRLGRAPSTVSRELRRNVDRRGDYRATSAHALAWQRASRPKPAKLWVNLELRGVVEDLLERRYSPEQIAGRLRVQFPADAEMWVSTETIYQSLYVTSRGALRRELTKCLRTGRKLRHPGRTAGAHNGPREMINIAERPQEADDRAVPGHWEGDLMIGKANKTAIGTLVERSTGYALLVHLPDGYKPEQVAPALAAKIQTLPDTLRRSLTWDQGPEMRDWKQIRIDTGIEICFCDPTHPGNAAPTRTPTSCCASTSPKAPPSAK
jgi:IS30 family transposase